MAESTTINLVSVVLTALISLGQLELVNGRSQIPYPVGEVNCEICPGGFFDGCNRCSCFSLNGKGSPKPICTQRFCTHKELTQPRCTGPPASAPVRKPTQKPNDIILNCKNCPGGFFDGCNSCGCDGPFSFPICTQRACFIDELEDPICNSDASIPSPRPTPETILNCENCPGGFFDGCNGCSCPDGPQGFSICTDRFCEDDEFGETSCNTFAPSPKPSQPSPEVVDCQNCPGGFFDGCNVCGCDENGLAFCTLRFCLPEELEEPRCNKEEEEEEEEEISCDNCESYFDGCNHCTCTSSGLAACTKRFCSPELLEDAYCKVPKPTPQPTEEISCKNCQKYNDGCNDCYCNEKGDPVCTERFCLVAGDPECFEPIVPSKMPTKQPNRFDACSVEGIDLKYCESYGCTGYDSDGNLENPHCERERRNGRGCRKCEDGFFRKKWDIPCIDCSLIDNCDECTDFGGCKKCACGFRRVKDEQCGFRICVPDDEDYH